MDKKQIARNILARADSALYFLDHALKFAGIKADDIAWQRSILIIISYAFELTLKAEIVFSSENTKIDDIDKELRSFGHNIENIINELKKRKLLPLIKISDYKVNSNGSFKQYTIRFEDKKEIIVEDFVDIRYDYTEKALRNIIGHDIVTGYVDKILELSKVIGTEQQQKY